MRAAPRLPASAALAVLGPGVSLLPRRAAAPDCLFEPAQPGAPLLVCFGGMPDLGSEARFEFVGLRRTFSGVSGLHLRDMGEAWYLGGIAGVAGGFPGLLAWLADQVQRLQPSRTVVIGNSSGAYAALAVGSALAVDEVLAFVPRSGVDDAVSDHVGDERLRVARYSALSRYAGGGAPLDLVPWVQDAFDERVTAAGSRPRYRTRLRVFHAVDNREDSAHAARLQGLPETVVSSYPRGNHQLARVLRDSGELADIVGTALGTRPSR